MQPGRAFLSSRVLRIGISFRISNLSQRLRRNCVNERSLSHALVLCVSLWLSALLLLLFLFFSRWLGFVIILLIVAVVVVITCLHLRSPWNWMLAPAHMWWARIMSCCLSSGSATFALRRQSCQLRQHHMPPAAATTQCSQLALTLRLLLPQMQLLTCGRQTTLCNNVSLDSAVCLSCKWGDYGWCEHWVGHSQRCVLNLKLIAAEKWLLLKVWVDGCLLQTTNPTRSTFATACSSSSSNTRKHQQQRANTLGENPNLASISEALNFI